MIYLTTAFSINMLDDSVFPTVIDIKEADIDTVREMARYMPNSDGAIKNIMGHKDTAAVVGNLLGVGPLPANRESVKARWGDMFFVAQYRGERLEPGKTSLPEGSESEIKFYKVFVGDV